MEEKQFESNDIARFQENNKKNKARAWIWSKVRFGKKYFYLRYR